MILARIIFTTAFDWNGWETATNIYDAHQQAIEALNINNPAIQSNNLRKPRINQHRNHFGTLSKLFVDLISVCDPRKITILIFSHISNLNRSTQLSSVNQKPRQLQTMYYYPWFLKLFYQHFHDAFSQFDLIEWIIEEPFLVSSCNIFPILKSTNVQKLWFEMFKCSWIRRTFNKCFYWMKKHFFGIKLLIAAAGDNDNEEWISQW